MFSNPLSEERLESIKDQATEFMVTFSKEYLKMYGVAILQEAEEKASEKEDKRKLSYRDFNDVARQDLFQGQVFVKTGEGPGCFGKKWNKMYLSENSNFQLEFYGSESDCKGHKKPKNVLNLQGYNIVDNPRHTYSVMASYLSSRMNMGDDGIPIGYSQYSWALQHDHRENYVMQLHQGSNDPMFPCCGSPAVEPEDIGMEEYNKSGNQWLDVLNTCQKRGSARDSSSLKGRAFDLTVDKMTSTFSTLYYFKDDGTEAEILLDMIMEHTFYQMRDDILGEIEGPAAVRTTVYYKMKGTIMKMLKPIVDKSWGMVSEKVGEVGVKVQETISPQLDFVFENKEKLKNKVRDALNKDVVPKVAEFVKPVTQKIFEVLEKPLKEGLSAMKNMLKEQISKLGDKPSDYDLDQIPRTYYNLYDIWSISGKTVGLLRDLKNVFKDILDHLDVYELRCGTEEEILSIADALIFTLELEMKETGDGVEKLLPGVLEKYDHDSNIVCGQFLAKVMKMALVDGFKRIINPLVDPILSDLNDLIPEDLQDFINIYQLYDEIIDLFVGEPVEGVVYKSYPNAKPISVQKLKQEAQAENE